MEYKRLITCEHCKTTQTVDDVWLCRACGAPLRLEEKVGLINRALSKIANATTEGLSEGIDVSKWQGDMIWTCAAPKIDYTIIKASENVWEDAKYLRNVDICQELGIYYGVYHFCRAQYGYKDQARVFADRISGHLPAFADLESTGGLGSVALEQWIHNFVNEVQDLSGYTVGIYTRSNFWNTYVARNSWAYLQPLWVARYNSYISDPGVPIDWLSWVFWQWSADGNGKGPEYCAESASIDRDRFNGTTEEFYEYIGVTEPECPPCEDAPTYTVITDVLNVRSGPGVQYQDIGNLYKGDIIQQLNVAGSDVWIEFEPGKFCAHTYGGKKYLQEE